MIDLKSVIDLKLEVEKEIVFIFKSTNITLLNYEDGDKIDENQMIAKIYELQFSQDCVQINLILDQENLISAIVSIEDYNKLNIKSDTSLIATVAKDHIFISL